MLSDIINVLRFATDPQTRETLRAISNVASSKQSDWRKNIRRMSAGFNPTNWIGVNAFTNELIRRIGETGISDSKLHRFITIYSELISNAYRHGVQGQRDWKISVNCIYSRWFIQLDIADSGKGYFLGQVLEKVELERARGRRDGISGLELVEQLADNVHVNTEKSRVTIVVAGEDRIVIRTGIQILGKHQLLVVTWDDNTDWSFLTPNWDPLRDVLERAEQKLVLIRFGGPSNGARGFESIPGNRGQRSRSRGKTNGAYGLESIASETVSSIPPKAEGVVIVSSTECFRKAGSVVFEFALDKHHLFAYVVPQRWVYDAWKKDETAQLHFFRNELDAKHWLIENAESQITPPPKVIPTRTNDAPAAGWDFARHRTTPKVHHNHVRTTKRRSRK